MERVLEEAALEEHRARMSQNVTLRKSWGAATAAKNAIPPQPETDYDRCGIASAQVFEGEDNDRLSRIRTQREQMNEWIGESKEERSEAKRAEDEEERRWADFVRESTRLRDEAEAR
jgi:RIB43A